MKKTKRMTHFGYEFGCDARTPRNYIRKVKLRQTKTMWISECGRKYSKLRNGAVSGSWPMYRLDLSTVNNIKTDELETVQ